MTRQFTSGLSSSQVTNPAVAFSISGQRSAGTCRDPLAHCEIRTGVTQISFARADALPLDSSM